MVYQMLPENYRRFKMDFAVAYDEKDAVEDVTEDKMH
jgi:hypothetical protein